MTTDPGSSSKAPFVPPSEPTKPPAEGPVSLYSTSSQRRNWSASVEEIQDRRQTEWSAAKARLEKSWQKEASLSSSSTLPSTYPDIDSLSLLTRFYLVRQRALVRALGLPDSVDEVAASYVKRFYTRKSELEWHPKGIMLTSLYLACKITSYAMPLPMYASRLAGKQPSRAAVEENEVLVRGLEFQVADSIGWEMAIQGAGEALKGLFWDAQSLDPSPVALLQKLLPRSQALLLSARLTPLELTHTPSHIALACLYASSAEGPALVERWLDAKEAAARTERERRLMGLRGWKEKDKKERERMKNGVKSGTTLPKAFEEAIETPSELDEEITGPGTEDAPLGLSRGEIREIIQRIVAVIEAQEEEARSAADKASATAAPGKPAPAPIIDVEQVRKVDALLKACSDPEKAPESALYKKRKATSEAEAASKRQKKAAAGQIKDPFGESLARSLASAAAPKAGGGGGLFGKEIERRAAAAAAATKTDADSDEDVPAAPGLILAPDKDGA